MLGHKKRYDSIELCGKGNGKRIVGKALGFLQVRNVSVLVIVCPLMAHPKSISGKEPSWKVFHGLHTYSDTLCSSCFGASKITHLLAIAQSASYPLEGLIEFLPELV